MPNYVRRYVEGASVFLTIVTFERSPLFEDERTIELLRDAVRFVLAERPFKINAAVVLPDHLHLLLSPPENDVDYSFRIGRMKARFTKSLAGDAAGPTSTVASRAKHRERDIWQRRFFEHTIRDQDDFNRHVEYIHFNPVKHGYCKCPHQWPHSSFDRWVRAGIYSRDWCCVCNGATPPPPTLGYELE